MPKSIPEGLTQQHILSALADLDTGINHPFGQPTGYELLHDGKRYAPKTVIGLAFRHLTGEMLGPEDFSGGEAPGQANYVLRSLGFDVVEKDVTTKRDGFVTSRGFALPTDAGEMEDKLWFNMWQRRLWPYQELQEGVTLYWYDSTEQAIVWRSRVTQIERFEFSNKDEVRARFEAMFGVANLNDAYFDAATDHGYCLAYKVASLVRQNVPKPADYKFPQGGWLRCNDEEASDWLKSLPASDSPDGRAADALSKATSQVADSGYFSPSSLKDEREKKVREIVERRGQPDFRSKLIAAYGGRCAVTSCDAVAALEAAHIIPYYGPQSHHVTNGLLLRADLHTLFDLDLLGIDPDTMTVALAPAIKGTVYSEYEGRKLATPSVATDSPNHEALTIRWKQFLGVKEAT
jgi:hypothetical protein